MARKKKGDGTSARATETQPQDLAIVQHPSVQTNEEDVAVKDIADGKLEVNLEDLGVSEKTW
jgi:hypothetical protein